jgi:hypothetical protein
VIHRIGLCFSARRRILTLAQNLDDLITRRVTVGPPSPDADPKELYAQPSFTEKPDKWHPGPETAQPIVAAIVTSPRVS